MKFILNNMNLRSSLLLVLLLTGLTTAAAGQDPYQSETKKVEMKKLDKMVGQWKGSGWMQKGPKRETFTGTESVISKVDGLALLIEGRFVNPEGKVVHETLAAMSYDLAAKIYRMRTYLATGISGEYDLKIAGEGYEWGFQTPNGATIKYSISITPERWTETGEYTTDSKNWVKFFEMNLDKVK